MPEAFPTVRPVGSVLPPDVLARIANGDPELGGLTAADYGLGAGELLREAAARAWNTAKKFWAAFRAATEALPANESGVTQTRQQWLLPLLHELGYGEPEFRRTFSKKVDQNRDETTFSKKVDQNSDDAAAGRRSPIDYWAGTVPLHLVSFRQSLDHGTLLKRVHPNPAPPRLQGAVAGKAPHALLQEYLNSSDAIYGVLSNGHLLRLLRASASLTRQAYLQFDLEAMFEGGEYADFVLLFLVLHRSRLPGDPLKRGQPKPLPLPSEKGPCWLDTWRERAESQGTRALGELRQGVEAAIQALGTGFLVHPANDALRGRLASQNLSPHDYYQQLLRLIYRLLFLFVAEERDLIYPAAVPPLHKRRYL